MHRKRGSHSTCTRQLEGQTTERKRKTTHEQSGCILTTFWSTATFISVYLGCPPGTHWAGKMGFILPPTHGVKREWDQSVWAGRKPPSCRWAPESGPPGTSVSMHQVTLLYFQPRSDIWIEFFIWVTILYHNETGMSCRWLSYAFCKHQLISNKY